MSSLTKRGYVQYQPTPHPWDALYRTLTNSVARHLTITKCLNHREKPDSEDPCEDQDTEYI